MLDRVMNVRTRDIHPEPDFVVRQLSTRVRHRAIRPNGPGLRLGGGL